MRLILMLALLISMVSGCKSVNNKPIKPVHGAKTPELAFQSFIAYQLKGELCKAFTYIDPVDIKEVTDLIQRKIEIERKTQDREIIEAFGKNTSWQDIKSLPSVDFFCRILGLEPGPGREYKTLNSAEMKDIMKGTRIIGQVKESNTMIHMITRTTVPVQLDLIGKTIDDVSTLIMRDGRWYLLLDQTKKQSLKARYAI